MEKRRKHMTHEANRDDTDKTPDSSAQELEMLIHELMK